MLIIGRLEKGKGATEEQENSFKTKGVTSSDANEERKTIAIAIETERKRRTGQWRKAELTLVHFLRGMVPGPNQQRLLGPY